MRVKNKWGTGEGEEKGRYSGDYLDNLLDGGMRPRNAYQGLAATLIHTRMGCHGFQDDGNRACCSNGDLVGSIHCEVC